jgi:hypothetical protein
MVKADTTTPQRTTGNRRPTKTVIAR